MGGKETKGKGMSYDYGDTKRKVLRNLVMVIAIMSYFYYRV